MTDEEHQRPEGATDATVEAVGKVSEALEWVERARGRLYDFHQMMGRADFLLGDGADLLADAGHDELATWMRREIVGRNVLDGRWTFQIIEEFDELYWEPVRSAEARVRDELLEGKRHVFESELKDARRTDHRSGHERRPPAAHDPAVTPLDAE